MKMKPTPREDGEENIGPAVNIDGYPGNTFIYGANSLKHLYWVWCVSYTLIPFSINKIANSFS